MFDDTIDLTRPTEIWYFSPGFSLCQSLMIDRYTLKGEVEREEEEEKKEEEEEEEEEIEKEKDEEAE